MKLSEMPWDQIKPGLGVIGYNNQPGIVESTVINKHGDQDEWIILRWDNGDSSYDEHLNFRNVTVVGPGENRHGIPEDQLVIRFPNELYNAKPVIDAARYIRDKLPLADLGIEEMTPSDLFVLTLLRDCWYGTSMSGTHNTMPDDVIAFILQVQEAARNSTET